MTVKIIVRQIHLYRIKHPRTNSVHVSMILLSFRGFVEIESELVGFHSNLAQKLLLLLQKKKK